MSANRLSERSILAAALRLTRQVGVEKLTMRALADELGVSPMAPYHYVKGRDALLLLVADNVMRTVRPPPVDAGTWDERLWSYMQTMGDALAAYPGLSDFLLHQELTSEGRRYMERCIQVIRDGGFGEEQAREAFIAVYTYMWGRSIFLSMQNRRGAKRRRSGRRQPVPSIDELASGEHVEVGYRAMVTGLNTTLLTAPSGR